MFVPKGMNLWFNKIFRRACVCLGFSVLSVLPAPPNRPAAGYFELSAGVREAYRQTICLRFGEARATLDQLRRNEPDNLLPLLVEDYMDFLKAFLDNNAGTYKTVARHTSARLDRLARGDARSPWKLYCQGEIRLHRAILRGQAGDMLSGLNDLNLAYGLLSENQRLFPGFVANKKSLGVLHAALGNVPDEYKWALKNLAGMRGTTEQGRREIDEVLAHARANEFIFLEETLVSSAFMRLYLQNDEAGAWATVDKHPRLRGRENPLAGFVVAGIARRTGHNDEAIRIIRECPRGATFYPLPYLDYQLGIAKLCRLDRDANVPLQQFLQTFDGQNGVKEAHQKLGWHELVQGNPAGYQAQMALIKTRGADRIEPDKAALREARAGQTPDPRLLRARLLFDGGYYNRAFELLEHAEADYTGHRLLHLEYTYRLGRICHKMGKTTEALRRYNQTIGNGATESSHYACNAALQLGDLQASRGDYRAARVAYRQCLSLNPPDYAASLHAKAKAGLGRIGRGTGN